MKTKYYGDRIREVMIFKHSEFDETDEMCVSYTLRAGEIDAEELSLDDLKRFRDVLNVAIEEGEKR